MGIISRSRYHILSILKKCHAHINIIIPLPCTDIITQHFDFSNRLGHLLHDHICKDLK